eukprot:14741102-Ditylum_brightwellii.AAC.1
MACIGYQCDITILHLICSEDFAGRESDECRNVDTAVDEGLLKKNAPKYVFAHDQIESAAYSLIPEEQRASWHYWIGKKILNSCDSEEEIERVICLIADQLNRGKFSMKEEAERISLIELNYRAAKKAISSS